MSKRPEWRAAVHDGSVPAAVWRVRCHTSVILRQLKSACVWASRSVVWWRSGSMPTRRPAGLDGCVSAGSAESAKLRDAFLIRMFVCGSSLLESCCCQTLLDSAGSGFRPGSGSRVGMDFMGRMLTLILTNIYQPADALMTPEPLRLQGGPGWVQGTTPTDASRKHGAVKALSSAGGRRSSLLNWCRNVVLLQLVRLTVWILHSDLFLDDWNISDHVLNLISGWLLRNSWGQISRRNQLIDEAATVQSRSPETPHLEERETSTHKRSFQIIKMIFLFF